MHCWCAGVPNADSVPSRPRAFPVFACGSVSPTKSAVRDSLLAAPSPCDARAASKQPECKITTTDTLVEQIGPHFARSEACTRAKDERKGW